MIQGPRDPVRDRHAELLANLTQEHQEERDA